MTGRKTALALATTALVVAALTIGAFILPAAAQTGSPSINCDAVTVALVLAAQDAYGFTPSMDLATTDGTAPAAVATSNLGTV